MMILWLLFDDVVVVGGGVVVVAVLLMSLFVGALILSLPLFVWCVLVGLLGCNRMVCKM